MSDAWTNPMGTDGFEFLEFAAPEPARLDKLFRSLGFSPAACHRSKDVTLYRQGAINLILNAEPASFAQSFARVHGASICAIGLRVRNARAAAERAQRLGAEIVPLSSGPMELNIPAIRSVGGSLIYLIDRYEGAAGAISIYDIDFVPIAGAEARPTGAGLRGIHSLDFAVHPGRRGVWTDFFARLFDFRTADGHLASPCGKIRVVLHEPGEDSGPVNGFPEAYTGEGIQRVVFVAPRIDRPVTGETAGDIRILPTDGTLGATTLAQIDAAP